MFNALTHEALLFQFPHIAIFKLRLVGGRGRERWRGRHSFARPYTNISGSILSTHGHVAAADPLEPAGFHRCREEALENGTFGRCDRV